MGETETLINRLIVQRDDLAAVASEGLSAEDADAIAAFAAEAQAGFADATPDDLRELNELLRIRDTICATTEDDPDAVRIGRWRRHRIEWTGAIPLSNRKQGECSPARQ
jgi:hypothetical protein